MSAVFLGAPGPIFQTENRQPVHANATVTASGSTVLLGYGASEISLFINVKATPTGTSPTLQYTIQEVDPGDGATVIGTSVSSTVITAIGIQRITLPVAFGGSIKVSWTIGGTSSPTFAQVYATLVAKARTVALTDSAGASISPATEGTLGSVLTKIPVGIVISSNNSTTTPLGSGASFSGTAELVTSYQEIDINVYGTVSGATGTLYFEFSPDGTNWDVSVPVSVTDLTNFVPQYLRVVLPWFRVRYVNGSTAQTTFRLTTIYHGTGALRLTRFLNQSISSNEPVENVRAAIMGQRPDTTFGNVPVDRNNFLKLTVGDIDPLAETRLIGADKSIFGAGVVAYKISQILADFSQALANNDVGTSVSGGGSVTQGSGLATLSTSTATTASAKAFTNSSPKYSPGREHFAQFTALFTSPTSANSHQRAGIYSSTGSPQNGFFIGYQGTTFGITGRNAGTDTFTARSSWNGDMLDANANSHFTRASVPEAIDFTKLNVYRIRYGWLGSAVVLFQVMAPDGNWVTFHTIRQPNLSAAPSITVPSNPFTMEVIKSSADATDLIMKTGSWDVGSLEDSSGYGPEDLKSRKYVHAVSAAQTADATVYTVSTGRVLLVTTLIIFCTNASLANDGRLDIKDGGTGGTLRLPITMGNSSNQVAASVQMVVNFPTPLRFSTNLFADVISGTLTYSVTALGYEVSA